MDPYESNCLVVDWDVATDIFGEKYWNDHDGIICVPTHRITEDEFHDLLVRQDLKTDLIKKAQFLIAEL